MGRGRRLNMGMTQEQLNEALQGLGSKVEPKPKKSMTQDQLDNALTSLNASVFEDQESVKAQASRQQEGESGTAYLARHVARSFESGLTSGADMLTPDSAVDLARGEATRGFNADEPYLFQNPTRFMDGSELSEHRDVFRNILFSGSEPLPPTGDNLSLLEQTVRFVTAGTEAASDPLNASKTVGRTLFNMMQSFLPAAVSDTVVTNTASAIADSDMSLSTKQNVLMGLGIVTGATTGIATSPLTAGYKAYKNVKGVDAAQGTAKYLTAEEQRFAKTVVDSQQDFYKIVERANVLQNSMGGEPLKIVPIVAALQNDIMKGKFIEYYTDGRDPTFRAHIDEAVGEFVKRQDEYINNLTTPAGIEGVTLPSAVKREVNNRTAFEEARQRNVQGKIDTVDAKLSNLTAGIAKSGSDTDIGAAAQSLIKAKKKLVTERFKPLYNEWKQTATDNGVVMPTDQVTELLDWVNKLPEDQGRFLKNFSPLLDIQKKTKTETNVRQGLYTATSLTDAKQLPPTVETLVVDSYSPADVMSLKTSVNGRIRDLKGATDSNGKVQLATLNRFKGVLNNTIEKMPDGYGTDLLNLDRQYYADMGIPFNSAGVAKMSVSKFSTTVSQDLTKLQSARDFLGSVGEDGVPVLKDAIYTKIHNMAVKGNDVANEKLINNWLANEDNVSLIDLVPNMREEITNGAEAIANAKQVRARMVTEYNTNAHQAADDFLKSVGRQGLNPTVNQLITSEGTSLSTLMPLFDHMDAESTAMFKTGIRLGLADKALKFKDPVLTGGSKHAAVAYVNSNREVFTEFFGKEYIRDLEGALEMFDIVSTIDTDNLPFKMQSLKNELLEAETGVGLSGYAAAYRRYATGITSLPQVGTALGSKMAQSKLSKQRAGKLMNLIVDPTPIAKLAREYKEYKAATSWDKAKVALKSAGTVVGQNARKGAYIGGREAVLDKLGDVPDPTQQELQSMPVPPQAPRQSKVGMFSGM